MRIVLNILWAIFGSGLVIAFQYALGGLILCLTFVGIPFGLQCFKMARLALFPFGMEIREQREGLATGALGLFMNVLWIIFGGFTTFVSHIVLGCAWAVTIIGLPFAFQHLKLAVLALVPFGKEIVELPEE